MWRGSICTAENHLSSKIKLNFSQNQTHYPCCTSCAPTTTASATPPAISSGNCSTLSSRWVIIRLHPGEWLLNSLQVWPASRGHTRRLSLWSRQAELQTHTPTCTQRDRGKCRLAQEDEGTMTVPLLWRFNRSENYCIFKHVLNADNMLSCPF